MRENAGSNDGSGAGFRGAIFVEKRAHGRGDGQFKKRDCDGDQLEAGGDDLQGESGECSEEAAEEPGDEAGANRGPPAGAEPRLDRGVEPDGSDPMRKAQTIERVN
jgi:hypothetical protein